jgi:hypothetical protein
MLDSWLREDPCSLFAWHNLSVVHYICIYTGSLGDSEIKKKMLFQHGYDSQQLQNCGREKLR